MSQATIQKPQCVVPKRGPAILCHIPGEGTIYIMNGKHSLAKRELKSGKPLQKDIWSRMSQKETAVVRDMTEEEIAIAQKAILDRKQLLDVMNEKRRVTAMRARPVKHQSGRKF